MKGEINGEGKLLIHRGATFRPQMCPFVSGQEMYMRCGDWCPQFGEPSINAFDATHLTICMTRTLVFREGFEDHRMKD